MSLVRWCARVVVWALGIGAVVAIATTVLVPRLAGAAPYTVLTGSMQPSLPPGTLAVVKPVPVEEIGIGSVVTYQLRSGEPQVVTHRVVGVGADLTGERQWQTQGDANEVPDAAWVRPEQVRGEVWYAVPKLGYVSTWLTTAQRGLAVQLVALGLGLYALAMLGKSLWQRGRPREVVPA